MTFGEVEEEVLGPCLNTSIITCATDCKYTTQSKRKHLPIVTIDDAALLFEMSTGGDFLNANK